MAGTTRSPHDEETERMAERLHAAIAGSSELHPSPDGHLSVLTSRLEEILASAGL
jgi:hypothetical protein